MLEKIGSAFKKSFIKRIMALIFVFNIIFIILFICMTFFTTKNNIETIVNGNVLSAASSAGGASEDYFSAASVSVKMMQDNPDVFAFVCGNSGNDEAVSAALKNIMAGSGAEGLWCICDDSGKLVTPEGVKDVPVGFVYDWYESCENSSASALRSCFISDRNASPLGNESGIIIAAPIEKDGIFAGCVGAEFSAQTLMELINKRIYSSGVHAVAIDPNGVSACSEEEREDIDKIISGSGKTLAQLIEIGSESSAVQQFSSGKTTSFIFTVHISNGWQMAVILDGHYADGDFSKLYLQQIIVLACLFVLELIATLNVIRHEAKDIPEISSSIAEIAAGNYNFRINSSSENEIGLIAKSVDNLAGVLQDKIAVIDDYTNLDPTTGLQNRYKLYEYIEDLMISRDESRPKFALLFIDIDNFKWITETLGHRLGDDFLRTFGQRLKNAVPRVFRFSGDEFVILTDLKDDYGVIDRLILEIRNEFAEPIEILNDKIYVQFSVGVSIYPDDDTNPDMLLRDADIAMNRAKEKGKSRTAFYNAAFHQNVLSKTTIAQKLNKALENNEMFLNFQPIISVQNGDIHGFEVLIRWESEELGYVPPFTFIQIAEETGAIVEIGTWIFETACRYLKRMNEYNKDIIMSINVSAVQLKKKDFLEKISRTINVFGLNPANIQIEITETCLVDFMEGKRDLLQQIADMGIALALDDFGTGYSSFGYLKDMPIKTLKVDKSFVDEICSKNKDLQITGSIIDMVKNLGIKTVVEGVESIEQYNILSEMKCDYIQGFLMSKPLNANDAMEFVMRYDELHKPSKHTLQENSNKLANERMERERRQSEEQKQNI